MLALTIQVEGLLGAVEDLKESAARRHDKISSGSMLGTLHLDPAVAREVSTMRGEWLAAAEAAERAASEGREASAVKSMLQAEMAVVEDLYRNQRTLVETTNRSAIKAQRDVEGVRTLLQQRDAMLTELRAAETEQTAALAMADRTEIELRAALQAAEREVVVTRERGEQALERVEQQRDEEAARHAERARGWQAKLGEFLEAGKQRGMDLRVRPRAFYRLLPPSTAS